MYLWQTNLRTVPRDPAFPTLAAVARERRGDPTYRHEGRYRQRERHCLVKISLAGEGWFRRGDEEWRLPPGRAFLCHICDPATAYGLPADARRPWEFVFACFTGPAAIAMVSALSARVGPVVNLGIDHPLTRSLLAWRRRGPRTTLGPAQSAAAAADCLAALEEAATGPATPALELVARTADAIDSGAYTTVADLARDLGVSREHLSRTYREQQGITVAEALLQKRLRLACHDLKESDATVAQIAADHGFASPQHFSRCFKRVLGLPPGRFRLVGSVPLVV